MFLFKLLMRIAGHHVATRGRVCTLVFASGVVLLGLVGSRAWAQITEFELPMPNRGPVTIIVGPDGNLWFTEDGSGGNGIAHFNLADSTFTEIPTSDPRYLTVGPDGNLWFTEHNSNRIGTLTVAGNITGEVDLPNPGSGPRGITLGPDGNLWFTEDLGNQIGRITPRGDIREFPVPTADSQPRAITAGADGNLWFAEFNGDRLGRITPDGQITEFELSGDSGPAGLTLGPDGNVWFAAQTGNRIGRITPDGTVTQFGIPTFNSEPSRITTGPDGNLWFTESVGNKIGQITTDGVILAEYDADNPLGITTGPDGNIWFTEFSPNKIGRLYVHTPANHFLITVTPTAVSGTPFDVTVTALAPSGNIDTTYQGTVTFSTSDPDSGVALPADYTFTTGDGADNGVHSFSGGITLVTVGDQTLTVTDKVSGITGSVTVTVGPGP